MAQTGDFPALCPKCGTTHRTGQANCPTTVPLKLAPGPDGAVRLPVGAIDIAGQSPDTDEETQRLISEFPAIFANPTEILEEIPEGTPLIGYFHVTSGMGPPTSTHGHYIEWHDGHKWKSDPIVHRHKGGHRAHEHEEEEWPTRT